MTARPSLDEEMATRAIEAPNTGVYVTYRDDGAGMVELGRRIIITDAMRLASDRGILWEPDARPARIVNEETGEVWERNPTGHWNQVQSARAKARPKPPVDPEQFRRRLPYKDDL